MFHSGEQVQDLPSVRQPPTIDGDLIELAAAAARRSKQGPGTRLQRRMTELERAQISERIKQARKQAGLTQQELADLLHVQARTIANYESDRVPWRLLGKIAEATNVSQEWLLRGEQPAPASDLVGLREEISDVQAQLARIEQLVRQLVEPQGRKAEA